jgi:uncharacterized protein (DUF1499 family)
MAVGLLPLILSVVFPLCATPGAKSVPAPGILDFAHLTLPTSPNKALAAPAGFNPKPDLVTPPYKLAPDQLFQVVRTTVQAMPHTYALDDHPGHWQAAFVARTPTANFPDIIAIAVQPNAQGGSQLVMYSHSIYGYSDMGANLARLTAWLAAINAKIPPQS